MAESLQQGAQTRVSQPFFVNDETKINELIIGFANGVSGLIIIFGSGATQRFALNAIKLTI